MGIFNRDYMRSDSQFRLNPSTWNAVQMIIVICTVVWLCAIFGKGTHPLGTFLAENFKASWSAVTQGRIWTLLTSVFYHEDLFHVLLNLFVLWMFGRFIEEDWGKGRFLRFFIAAGVFGAVAHCLTLSQHSVIGASGGVLAVVLYFVLRDPRQKVLLFGVLPMETWMMAAIMIGYDVLGLLGVVGGDIAHVAHLAGAAYGAIYFTLERKGMLPRIRFGRGSSGDGRRRRRKVKRDAWIVPPDGVNPYTGRSAAEEKRLDHLLRKVGNGGLDALTPEEREFLMEMSKKSKR